MLVKRIAMEIHLDCGNVNELTAILEKMGFEVWLVDNDQRIVSDLLKNKHQTGGYLFARRSFQAGMPIPPQSAVAVAARPA
jgi:hypothetical protein